MIHRVMIWFGRALAFAGFMAVVGYASNSPRYEHRDPEAAQITVAFTHAAARVTECRSLSSEEMAELAANMKRTTECPRGRVPLHFVLEIDAVTRLDLMLPPTGIASDGRSSTYARIALPAGAHHIAAHLRDSRREEGFDWDRAVDLTLAPRANFTIDFKPEVGGFIFR